MKISVCIATYNGEKYIKEQLDSILCQLDSEDEVIISDDGSTDKTLEIINSYQDKRIIVLKDKKFKSPIYNFENAIKSATGDIIFLSDQDDKWKKNKVSKILECFEKDRDVTCVLTNADIIDENGNSKGYSFFKKKQYFGVFKNIIKNNFLGCTMAFVSNEKIKIFPFPKKLPMHDWFIGLQHILKGKVVYLDENLIEYRRHNNNVTGEKSASLSRILYWRWSIIKALISFK